MKGVLWWELKGDDAVVCVVKGVEGGGTRLGRTKKELKKLYGKTL